MLEMSMRTFELADDARMELDENWLSPATQRSSSESLESGSLAGQDLRIAGRQVVEPRLTAWYGDKDAVYSYSEGETNHCPGFAVCSPCASGSNANGP